MIKKIHFANESTKGLGFKDQGSGKTPSSLNSQPFSFAPSVQSDLFGYLKPHQQAALKPYLRLLKRDYQEKLCISLLDYLEGHGLDTLSEPVLNRMQTHIIEDCRLHPLTTRQPKSIGTVIKQLFPSLSGKIPSTLIPRL